MASKKKYYVVWQGYDPGIYESWSECKQQVEAYPGAKYKAFSSRKAASRPSSKSTSSQQIPDDIEADALTVDAACSGNPGLMEYRGVWLKDRVEEFRKGPFKKGTNNIGEFLAIIHAAALLMQRKDKETPIYTDSRTAMAWVRKKKVNTQLKFDRQNQRLKKLVDRAENWIRNNDIPNPIKKWDTKNWGEIPADFGRK